MDQILKESLRLWPTVPAFAVFSKEPTTLLQGKYPVTNKQTILLLLPTLQRDPTVWEKPDEFYPEQMERSRFNALPPDSWKPFGNLE
ncbi:MAG: cytochrome P450 [Proteobacteria bacterium]|nr:MAG: cytochrome P450 [Pseudomonadota bacterium]